jgi:hypothetical protein
VSSMSADTWAAPLHIVLRRADREVIEAKLGAYAERLLGDTPEPEEGEKAIAMEGKTLRGSQKRPGAGDRPRAWRPKSSAAASQLMP